MASEVGSIETQHESRPIKMVDAKLRFPGYQLFYMAYGQNKSELIGGVALTAENSSHFLPPLPLPGVNIRLEYPGKVPEKSILDPVNTEYCTFETEIKNANPQSLHNSLFWTDNWLALHSLIQSKHKARLIYLDPPYATGMEFHSRNQEHAYTDTLGDAAYIEFMRRRLILMREVLDEEGSIYVHIGHQMIGTMKVLLDEIFGQRNFRNIITRRKCSSKNFTKNQYPNLNDYVLFYSKGPNYIWNKPTEAPEDAWIAKEYPKFDEKGQYKLVPIHAPGIRKGETGTEWKGMMPPPGKHWQLTPTKLDALEAKGEIYWSKNGNPRRKVYLSVDKGIPITDYWDQYRDAHHQSILITGYPTEKNFEMLKMIISASSNVGDLVIDPFNGSGTTIHAAHTLGRSWVGIDQSLPAIKTTIDRMKNGRTRMGDFVAKNRSNDLFDDTAPPREEEAMPLDLKLFIDKGTANAYPKETADLKSMMT